MQHIESYWSEVATSINSRAEDHIVAGDAEPFYQYKRNKFIRLFIKLPFKDKSVMEYGCGPGGNLKIAAAYHPSSLTGIDISEQMLALAKKNLNDEKIQLVKTDGIRLPFADASFDLIYTSTVLQHNTVEADVQQSIREICRVAKDSIYIFERIESRLKGDVNCMGRPVQLYRSYIEPFDFELVEARFIHINISYMLCGLVRKLLQSKQHKEGDPSSGLLVWIQQYLILPISSKLDTIFQANRDLGMLWFRKRKNI